MRFGFGAFLAPFVLVGVEVGGLLGEEALRLVSDILSGFDGFLARKIEAVFAGEGA